MYLKDGREIYESQKYPGYYIEANTGNYCDEQGNLVGGNEDMGDNPREIQAARFRMEAELLAKIHKSRSKRKKEII